MSATSKQSPTISDAQIRSVTATATRWWHAIAFQAWLPRILGYVLVVGVWQSASGRLVPAFTLPPPTAMVAQMWELLATSGFWFHFSATIRTIAVAYALSFVIGLGVGIVMIHPWVDAFVRDWVVSFLNTPGLVFVLVATMVFGFHPLGPITAIVATSFPFVTINVAEGVKAIPKDLTDMGTAFGMGEARRMRQIVIPFLAPYTIAALRYGFSIAWKIATLAELFGSSRGVGFMIRREFELFSMSGMLAWILLFCAFALSLELLLQIGMRRYFRWRPEPAV